jgi:hypothetical protein
MQVFNAIEGNRRKVRGMAKAEAGYLFMDQARKLARTIALLHGQVTADDVQKALHRRGLPLMGCAAGPLFRGPEWLAIGWRASDRIQNHGRAQRVWRLK